MHDSRPWYMALWAAADASLKGWAKTLQKALRALRLVRALLLVGVVAILLSGILAALAAAGAIPMEAFLVAYAVATLFLLVPIAALAVLVALPLRARSVTRLIDMGYPANFRELVIRVAARKLRDESIETEELLVETAVNETRKVLRRMEEGRRRAAEPGPPAPPPPTAPPPPPPL